MFILCTKICRAYPKEFIESASFAAAAGASAHANAQHGVPVRRRSNSIGTFADLFFMLFSIISMPFWRDWSANGVGSIALHSAQCIADSEHEVLVGNVRVQAVAALH